MTPLQTLTKQKKSIEAWFDKKWQETNPCFYASVDIRNANFKISPVDTNLFPAGFNNLNRNCFNCTTQAVIETLLASTPSAKRILIIPESHTRNKMYLENIAVLTDILKAADFDVKIGSLISELEKPQQITLPSNKTITLTPIHRKENTIYCADFSPDVILLNNDLTAGIPNILREIKQPIIPPLTLGWSMRLKSAHFQHYQTISTEFARHFNFDPWLIAPLFRYCGEINFMTREGENCLARNSETLIKAIQQKYDEYNIHEKPFVMIKADAGTYGMSVMKIDDPEQIKQLNRKQRTKMAKGKGGKTVTKAIVQEGVYTHETQLNAVAEPVVYLIGKRVIGGFYRLHREKKRDENLNVPGMEFSPLPCNEPSHYIYSVISRLAALAAAQEQKMGSI